MSCNWSIVCVTCSDGKDASEKVVMDFDDNNHGLPLIEVIIDIRDDIKHLDDAIAALKSNEIYDFVVILNFRQIPLTFLREHEVCDLHPINEYGDIGPCRRNDEFCDMEKCVCGQFKSKHPRENRSLCPPPLPKQQQKE